MHLRAIYIYIIELSTGTTTHLIENSFSNSIYPNPATNKFTIKSEANNIKLYNSLGVKIDEQTLKEERTTFSRDNLANGIYFYSLNKDEKTITSGKLILK